MLVSSCDCVRVFVCVGISLSVYMLALCGSCVACVCSVCVSVCVCAHHTAARGRVVISAWSIHGEACVCARVSVFAYLCVYVCVFLPFLPVCLFLCVRPTVECPSHDGGVAIIARVSLGAKRRLHSGVRVCGCLCARVYVRHVIVRHVFEGLTARQGE